MKENVTNIINLLNNIEESDSIDISLLKKLKVELKLLEESDIKNIGSFLEAILNKIPDPIFIKDDTHTWRFLNDSACELFGYQRSDLIGKSDYDIFPQEEADEYWRVDNEVLKTGKEIRNEEFQTHPITKERRILDTKKTLFEDDKGDKYIIGIIRDITNQKKAEKQLRQEIESKKKIFSILAHDLKEPFNALLGLSSLLKNRYSQYSDEKRLDFINNINSIANNSYSFILNILDWAAAQTGKLSYRPDNISLIEVVDEVLVLLKETAYRKDLKIEILAINKDFKVFADRNLLATVLRNLISNAIKYTPKNGNIKITIEQESKDKVTVCVIDTGIGIDKKTAKILFNENGVHSNPGTDGEKGIGLGLMLCKDFVEINKGELWFVDNEEQGTKFCFTVPLSISKK